MKIRLDKLLVEKKLAETRQKAQALIAVGGVTVDGRLIDKAGTQVSPACRIDIQENSQPFVSRGGRKLEAGLDYFHIRPENFICVDIGASTGGFTDCLLQRGAKKVYAVDVGYGQLAWKLRQDERVVVLERTNARYLTTDQVPEPVDFAVIDAAFISLKLLLPPLVALFGRGIAILALIKPQFEVGKGLVGKGGVVRDDGLHQAVINDIVGFAGSIGLFSQGVIPSPILGPKGNREFLIYLTAE